MSPWTDTNDRIIDIDGLIKYIETLRNVPKYYPGIVNDLLSMMDFDPYESNALREKKLAVSIDFCSVFHLSSFLTLWPF